MPVSFCCRYLLGLLLLLAGCMEVSDPRDAIPDPKTLGETYVSNPDSVLRPATVRLLNAELRALDQSGRAHIDVAVARSIGNSSPKNMATGLFNRWKIGDKDKNNGLLMLLVLDKRRVEFETGYGLEADVPDIICYRIQQRRMLPYLRAGEHDSAVINGVHALIARLQVTDTTAATYDARLAAATDLPTAEELAPKTPADDWFGVALFTSILFWPVLFLIAWGIAPKSQRKYKELLLMLIPLAVALAVHGLHAEPYMKMEWFMAFGYLLPLGYLHYHVWRLHQHYLALPAATSRPERYAYLREAYSDLAFGAFFFPVGLLFYWIWNRRRMHQLRAAPYACPNCTGTMHRLSEKQDDAFLEPGKVAEEKVKSVDYDVFQCAQCRHTITFDFKNLSTQVKACPACHYLTLKELKPTVEVAATTSSAGWGWQQSRCAHCQHETPQVRYHIPVKSSSSSSSGGSSSGGGSSSSSGGSSGGGGSGSSW